MSEPVWFDELNLSCSAFAEDSSGLQQSPERRSTVRKRDWSNEHDFDPTEGMTDFDDMHLDQGLDAIVRVDSQRKKLRAGINPLYCILFAVIAAVAITTMSIMVPKSRNESHSVNVYAEQVNEIKMAFLKQGILDESDSLEPGSPRYEAIQWAAAHSGSLSSPGSLSQKITSYPFIARYVIVLTLLTLRGPWFPLDSSICELFHRDGDEMSGIRCDEEGLPISLNLGTCSFHARQIVYIHV